MRENKYWVREEEKICKWCGVEKETWKHVWEKCGRWGAERNWMDKIEEVLGEKREREIWLRKLDEMREGYG